jgi:hypothetical protein
MKTEINWKELRKAFAPEAVGLLPKVSCYNCAQAIKAKTSKKYCDNHRMQKCTDCGNYITTGHIHLDYVGHAAVTDRLNSVDPTWTWEPVATDPQGSPALDKEGNLWIRLTVGGVTRLGVGDGSNMKERIGDAIRNAAMRFGVALDLWSKEELESTLAEPELKNDKPSSRLATEDEQGVADAPAARGTSLVTLRAKLAEKGYKGQDATNLVRTVISKDKPETEDDVQTLLQALDIQPALEEVPNA